MGIAEELDLRQISRGFNLNECAIYHDSNDPETSLETHVDSERLALSKRLATRAKIYLDTNYWILLRNVKLGRVTEVKSIALYELLRELVASSKIVCPVSASNLFEVLRQQDIHTRITTAQVMDDFSCGIGLRSHFDRATDDFVRAIYRISNFEYANWRIDFDYISHLLGFIPLLVDRSELVVGSPLAYAKASYDMGTFTTLEDMLPGLDADSPETLSRLPSQESWVNEMNQYKSTLKGKNYNETQISEFLGGLKASLRRLNAAMMRTYQIDFGRYPTPTESELVSGKLQLVLDQLCRLFAAKKLSTALLPQIHIQASIFAKVLTESTREVSKTDFDDVWHATDALPSCQLFFTENYLCHLLTHPPTNLARDFDATVVAKQEDALAELKKLT